MQANTHTASEALMTAMFAPITTYKSTLEVTDTYAVGTVRELVAAGLTVNGVQVDKAMLSVLIALDFAVCVGVAEKVSGASGIAPKIYKFKFDQEAAIKTLPVELSFT